MTNNWVTTPINKFCKIVSGSTPKTSEPTYWGGDIAWVTPMDLSKLNNKYITNGARNITQSGLKSCSAELVPANSLVMSSRAPIGYFAINKSPVATNQGCKSFVCDDSIDIEFLYYALNQHIDSIKRLGSGSTFAEVGKKQVESLIIKVPGKAIQQKIGDILSSVDEAIQKTDQIIQKIELLNKGIIAQLLDNSSNLTVKLNTVCSKITDGTHRTPKYIVDGIPFLRINDIQSDKINWERCKYISKDEHNELIKRCKPEKGDVLLSKNGTIGITKVVDWEREFSIFVSLCLIKPDKSKVLPEYLAEVAGSDYVMNQVRKRSKQGAVTNLHLEEIRDFDIPLPNTERQKDVVAIIKDLKLKKVREEIIFQSLIKLKNGIMQDIFSQKVQIN